MPEMIPINQAKKSFSQFVRQAEHGEAVIISRRGKAVVVLVANEDYSQLMRLKAAGPDLGLAGLAGTTDDGEELAEILATQIRSSRESIVLE